RASGNRPHNSATSLSSASVPFSAPTSPRRRDRASPGGRTSSRMSATPSNASPLRLVITNATGGSTSSNRFTWALSRASPSRIGVRRRELLFEVLNVGAMRSLLDDGSDELFSSSAVLAVRDEIEHDRGEPVATDMGEVQPEMKCHQLLELLVRKRFQDLVLK